ncbi:MAG: CPBP family intramembrane metalloprotease [Acidobacteriota bacterium]|nr:CPBP family intramembrane metalloprotease [Acidobacteriota bacterium]
MPTDSQSTFPIASELTPSEPARSVSPRVHEPIDPNNPRWGLGGAFLVWVASLILLAVIPLFFLIPYSLQRGLDPGSPEYVNNLASLALTDKTAIFLQVLALLPTHLLTFGLVWALVTRFGHRPFLASLGWGWSGRLRFWGSVGLGVALFLLGTGIAKLLGADQPTQLEQIINSSPGARYLIAALAVLTAPFVEEFIYRGVLYAALQSLVGVAGAVLLVLGLFTLIHVPQYWPNFGIIAAVGMLSVSLTIIRAYTGRLLPCIVIHLVFNGITSLLLLIEPHLPKLGPASGQTASAVLLLTNLWLSVSGL